MIGNDIYLFL